MSFEDDVFLSYRHLDNQLKDDQGKGWGDTSTGGWSTS